MKAHPTDVFPSVSANGWTTLLEPACRLPNRAIAAMRYSTPWMRKGELMRPGPSSSRTIVAVVVRLPRLFAEQPGYSVAGDLVLYAWLLASGCHFEGVPNAGTVHHRLHRSRCAPGSR